MWLLLSMVCCCLFGLGSAWTQPASCHVRQSSFSSGLEQSLGRMEETLQIIATSLSRIADTLDQDPNELTTSIPPTTMPPILLGSFENPAASCNNISQDRPSGEYWVQGNDTNPPIQAYCDTSSRNCSCNTTGGWARVANLDMTDPNQNCPDGFRLMNRTEPPLRTCGRPDLGGCVSTTFPTHGIEYSRVCGRVIGYQDGPSCAFKRATDIEYYYVDGVSLTHGQSPRQHIWTFAAADSEGTAAETYPSCNCPCTRPGFTDSVSVPSFVGHDYFCDTGAGETHPQAHIFYLDDPLWDGQGCGDNSTCCEFNNPPWFCKQLPQPTTDDIELRICNNEGGNSSPIERVEIYIN